MTRAELEQIPAGTELLRRIRYTTVDQLADLTDDDLELAARWLRAAGYDARAGATHLDNERNRRQRRETTCPSPTPET